MADTNFKVNTGGLPSAPVSIITAAVSENGGGGGSKSPLAFDDDPEVVVGTLPPPAFTVLPNFETKTFDIEHALVYVNGKRVPVRGHYDQWYVGQTVYCNIVRTDLKDETGNTVFTAELNDEPDESPGCVLSALIAEIKANKLIQYHVGALVLNNVPSQVMDVVVATVYNPEKHTLRNKMKRVRVCVEPEESSSAPSEDSESGVLVFRAEPVCGTESEEGDGS